MQVKEVNRRTAGGEVVFVMSRWQRALKRAFDIVCGLLGLILSSPIFIVASIAILTEGGGSVFYSQERIGKGGKPFKIRKFRTMREDAESDGPQLAQECDARLTRVGRFLRKHHLDELPQFWNVLLGEMSMVGYRPERQYFIDKIMEQDGRYKCLYAIRPGVTSEATIYNGYTDTMEKMLERLNMDLHYMETATLKGDLVIILKTFGIMSQG